MAKKERRLSEGQYQAVEQYSEARKKLVTGIRQSGYYLARMAGVVDELRLHRQTHTAENIRKLIAGWVKGFTKKSREVQTLIEQYLYALDIATAIMPERSGRNGKE